MKKESNHLFTNSGVLGEIIKCPAFSKKRMKSREHQHFLLAISQTVDDLEQRKQDLEMMSMAFEIAVEIQHEIEGCSDVDIIYT